MFKTLRSLITCIIWLRLSSFLTLSTASFQTLPLPLRMYLVELQFRVPIRISKSSISKSEGFEMIPFLVVTDRANTRICHLNRSTGFYGILPEISPPSHFFIFYLCLWINNFIKDVRDYNHIIPIFFCRLYSLQSLTQKAKTYHA